MILNHLITLSKVFSHKCIANKKVNIELCIVQKQVISVKDKNKRYIGSFFYSIIIHRRHNNDHYLETMNKMYIYLLKNLYTQRSYRIINSLLNFSSYSYKHFANICHFKIKIGGETMQKSNFYGYVIQFQKLYFLFHAKYRRI